MVNNVLLTWPKFLVKEKNITDLWLFWPKYEIRNQEVFKYQDDTMKWKSFSHPGKAFASQVLYLKQFWASAYCYICIMAPHFRHRKHVFNWPHESLRIIYPWAQLTGFLKMGISRIYKVHEIRLSRFAKARLGPTGKSVILFSSERGMAWVSPRA